jgi:predicted PurR-regulated permease PerM
VALQQIEGHIVAPQIFSHTLRINPLLVIFALLAGAEIYGVVGALIALPLAAIARETGDYLQRHLVLEPWGTTLPTRPLDEPDVGPPDPDEERPRRLASRR